MRRPDRRTPFKTRVKKSFGFVDQIWNAYVQTNCQDIKYVAVSFSTCNSCLFQRSDEVLAIIDDHREESEDQDDDNILNDGLQLQIDDHDNDSEL